MHGIHNLHKEDIAPKKECLIQVFIFIFVTKKIGHKASCKRAFQKVVNFILCFQYVPGYRLQIMGMEFRRFLLFNL